MSVAGHITLGNILCNLCRDNMRDKLQEKLPSVTAPLEKLLPGLAYGIIYFLGLSLKG